MFITPSLPSDKFPSPTLNTAQVEPDVVLLPVAATPVGSLELPHDAGSGNHLSLAEINKVLYLSGMTDAGRFDAIRAITDIDQFLGVFGINYAELKEILALPDDSFKAASGDDAQSPKDIASTPPPEYVSPYPVPKIDYSIIRDENGLPISSDTAAQEQQLADGSTSLTPQTLDEVHNAGLLPPPVDASADAATSSASPDLADQNNFAALVVAPESPLIEDVLPDGPCTADLPISEAAPVPVPAEDPIQGVLPDTPCSMELPAGELLPVPVHASTDSSTSLGELPVGVAESTPAEPSATLASQPNELSGTLPIQLQTTADNSQSEADQGNPTNAIDPHDAGGGPVSIPDTPAPDSHDDDQDTPLTAASSSGGIELTMKLGEAAPRSGDFSNHADVLPNENGSEPSVSEAWEYPDYGVDPALENVDQLMPQFMERARQDAEMIGPEIRRRSAMQAASDLGLYTPGHPHYNGDLAVNGGGGGGGGLGFGAGVAVGIGSTLVAGGIALGIAALADPDGVKKLFGTEDNASTAPDPHDNTAPLTHVPDASTDVPLSQDVGNIRPPAVTLPDSALYIANTPVMLMVALSEHGGISFADVAGDLPAIQATLAQWISNAAPDYPLALQGLDFADFSDGSGLSVMVYLNAYVDPSTGFNSALTAESIATLQSTVQHQVDGWLHNAAPEIALVATSTTSVVH